MPTMGKESADVAGSHADAASEAGWASLTFSFGISAVTAGVSALVLAVLGWEHVSVAVSFEIGLSFSLLELLEKNLLPNNLHQQRLQNANN